VRVGERVGCGGGVCGGGNVIRNELRWI